MENRIDTINQNLDGETFNYQGIFNKKKHKFILVLKWYKNDRGGDRRTICIDYKNEADKKQQINKIINDFKTLPMDIGKNKGEIPYSVAIEK